MEQQICLEKSRVILKNYEATKTKSWLESQFYVVVKL